MQFFERKVSSFIGCGRYITQIVHCLLECTKKVLFRVYQ
ncbi:hypothetical protein VCRA2119O430_20193 [Vibrio crassostreae]|nr:hypothetical protein VCRA2117O428_20193 [Vibrio crassostreae]CAK1986473.1 hypothetical protein VCRA2114O422_20235 [Vibrio crassostreae]CAK1986551.1 hypothetical protein VCRA2119O430_20193 [Vibrio crassostreae]CAK1992522.1 hypothetical protein VCRA2119O431_20236 [Vibrio crassostreae]CAK2199572.1 hypothetical protein VCRA2113O413_80194 [Vibrio crassostreae]